MRSLLQRLKNHEDGLSKQLSATNYKVFNITSLVNDLLKEGSRTIKRATWVKFVRKKLRMYHTEETRKLALLTRGYETIVLRRISGILLRWRFRYQWKRFTFFILKSAKYNNILDFSTKYSVFKRTYIKNVWVDITNRFVKKIRRVGLLDGLVEVKDFSLVREYPEEFEYKSNETTAKSHTVYAEHSAKKHVSRIYSRWVNLCQKLMDNDKSKYVEFEKNVKRFRKLARDLIKSSNMAKLQNEKTMFDESATRSCTDKYFHMWLARTICQSSKLVDAKELLNESLVSYSLSMSSSACLVIQKFFKVSMLVKRRSNGLLVKYFRKMREMSLYYTYSYLSYPELEVHTPLPVDFNLSDFAAINLNIDLIDNISEIIKQPEFGATINSVSESYSSIIDAQLSLYVPLSTGLIFIELRRDAISQVGIHKHSATLNGESIKHHSDFSVYVDGCLFSQCFGVSSLLRYEALVESPVSNYRISYDFGLSNKLANENVYSDDVNEISFHYVKALTEGLRLHSCNNFDVIALEMLYEFRYVITCKKQSSFTSLQIIDTSKDAECDVMEDGVCKNITDSSDKLKSLSNVNSDTSASDKYETLDESSESHRLMSVWEGTIESLSAIPLRSLSVPISSALEPLLCYTWIDHDKTFGKSRFPRTSSDSNISTDVTSSSSLKLFEGSSYDYISVSYWQTCSSVSGKVDSIHSDTDETILNEIYKNLENFVTDTFAIMLANLDLCNIQDLDYRASSHSNIDICDSSRLLDDFHQDHIQSFFESYFDSLFSSITVEIVTDVLDNLGSNRYKIGKHKAQTKISIDVSGFMLDKIVSEVVNGIKLYDRPNPGVRLEKSTFVCERTNILRTQKRSNSFNDNINDVYGSSLGVDLDTFSYRSLDSLSIKLSGKSKKKTSKQPVCNQIMPVLPHKAVDSLSFTSETNVSFNNLYKSLEGIVLSNINKLVGVNGLECSPVWRSLRRPESQLFISSFVISSVVEEQDKQITSKPESSDIASGVCFSIIDIFIIHIVSLLSNFIVIHEEQPELECSLDDNSKIQVRNDVAENDDHKGLVHSSVCNDALSVTLESLFGFIEESLARVIDSVTANLLASDIGSIKFNYRKKRVRNSLANSEKHMNCTGQEKGMDPVIPTPKKQVTFSHSDSILNNDSKEFVQTLIDNKRRISEATQYIGHCLNDALLLSLGRVLDQQDKESIIIDDTKAGQIGLRSLIEKSFDQVVMELAEDLLIFHTDSLFCNIQCILAGDLEHQLNIDVALHDGSMSPSSRNDITAHDINFTNNISQATENHAFVDISSLFNASFVDVINLPSSLAILNLLYSNGDILRLKKCNISRKIDLDDYIGKFLDRAFIKTFKNIFSYDNFYDTSDISRSLDASIVELSGVVTLKNLDIMLTVLPLYLLNDRDSYKDNCSETSKPECGDGAFSSDELGATFDHLSLEELNEVHPILTQTSLHNLRYIKRSVNLLYNFDHCLNSHNKLCLNLQEDDHNFISDYFNCAITEALLDSILCVLKGNSKDSHLKSSPVKFESERLKESLTTVVEYMSNEIVESKLISIAAFLADAVTNIEERHLNEGFSHPFCQSLALDSRKSPDYLESLLHRSFNDALSMVTLISLINIDNCRLYTGIKRSRKHVIEEFPPNSSSSVCLPDPPSSEYQNQDPNNIPFDEVVIISTEYAFKDNANAVDEAFKLYQEEEENFDVSYIDDGGSLVEGKRSYARSSELAQVSVMSNRSNANSKMEYSSGVRGDSMHNSVNSIPFFDEENISEKYDSQIHELATNGKVDLSNKERLRHPSIDIFDISEISKALDLSLCLTLCSVFTSLNDGTDTVKSFESGSSFERGKGVMNVESMRLSSRIGEVIENCLDDWLYSSTKLLLEKHIVGISLPVEINKYSDSHSDSVLADEAVSNYRPSDFLHEKEDFSPIRDFYLRTFHDLLNSLVSVLVGNDALQTSLMSYLTSKKVMGKSSEFNPESIFTGLMNDEEIQKMKMNENNPRVDFSLTDVNKGNGGPNNLSLLESPHSSAIDGLDYDLSLNELHSDVGFSVSFSCDDLRKIQLVLTGLENFKPVTTTIGDELSFDKISRKDIKEISEILTNALEGVIAGMDELCVDRTKVSEVHDLNDFTTSVDKELKEEPENVTKEKISNIGKVVKDISVLAEKQLKERKLYNKTNVVKDKVALSKGRSGKDLEEEHMYKTVTANCNSTRTLANENSEHDRSKLTGEDAEQCGDLVSDFLNSLFKDLTNSVVALSTLYNVESTNSLTLGVNKSKNRVRKRDKKISRMNASEEDDSPAHTRLSTVFDKYINVDDVIDNLVRSKISYREEQVIECDGIALGDGDDEIYFMP